jgi:hypothetical protein
VLVDERLIAECISPVTGQFESKGELDHMRREAEKKKEKTNPMICKYVAGCPLCFESKGLINGECGSGL